MLIAGPKIDGANEHPVNAVSLCQVTAMTPMSIFNSQVIVTDSVQCTSQLPNWQALLGYDAT